MKTQTNPRPRRSGDSRLSVALLTLLVFGTTGRAMAAAPGSGGLVGKPRNVLVNGGFEQGSVGWKLAPGHRLLVGRKQAHSGKSCLFGEVTKPKQFLRLVQRVPVRAGNLYEFEAWVRATNRTKFVLWIVKPGETQKTRSMAGVWQRLPPRWRRVNAPITITRDGVLELQLIAPSAVGAPVGKLWLDDVVLRETPMPATLEVTRGEGFNDEPCMARTDDGNIYLAWNSFRDGHDTLEAARFTRGPDGKLGKAAAWRIAGDRKTYVLKPRLVSAGNRAWLLYAAETGRDDWDVFAVPLSVQGPGRRVAVGAGPGIDINPAGCARGDVLWVAWESNREGGRQIWLAALRDTGRVSAPERVSAGGESNYDPSVAVRDSGEVAVAWTGFRQGNYDVYFRKRGVGGGWGPEVRLTRAPALDRHPVLLAHRDAFWLIYENANSTTYHTTSTKYRRLLVARVTPGGGLEGPVGMKESALYAGGEAAAAAFDAVGRLWVAFLRPRNQHGGWDAFLTGFTGNAWTPLQRLSSAKGMDRTPVIVIDGSRAVVVRQKDDIPNRWKDEKASTGSKSDVALAEIELDKAPPAAAPEFEKFVEPDDVYKAAALRAERGVDAARRSIMYNGRKLTLFYGDLHEHTAVSPCNRRGDQSMEESYQHMRDVTMLDFAAVTDHGYSINPYLWNYTAKMARVNYDPGRFLTFLAEEWTSTFEKYDKEHPYGYYGHRNLVLADAYFPRWWNAVNGQTPAQVWQDLRKLKANFVHIPHQLADTGNVPTDWKFVDETAQPVAEIFQTRGSYEYKGAPRQAGRVTPAGWFIQDAWARGTVIGVIASPDHGGGYGMACVFAPKLSRGAILDALRARHCFGSTAAKMFLDVRVNGRLMGEKAPAPTGPVTVAVRADCPQEIDRVEVCRNNEFIYSSSPGKKSVQFEYRDARPIRDRWSYYYVRVIQKDGEIAWSSPVWLGKE
ncbi:MAG: hypothetical protein GXP31_13035 [Kiritimatiellaeota bacterium]|nr:hypothetical protein [Kiritimatiellota bacterium]